MKDVYPPAGNYGSIPTVNPIPEPSAPSWSTSTQFNVSHPQRFSTPANPLAQPLMYSASECCNDILIAPFQLRSYLTMFIYHPLNLALGIFGNGLMFIFLIVGVCLIPLCCCGLLVLRLAFELIPCIARLDVVLHNCAAERNQEILTYSNKDESYSTLRQTKSLGSCNFESIIAIIYFLLIKQPIAALGFTLGTLMWISSIFLLLSPFTGHVLTFWCFDHTTVIYPNTIAAPLLGLLLFFLSVVLSRALAIVSMAVTRYMLCEYLPVYVCLYTPVVVTAHPNHPYQTV